MTHVHISGHWSLESTHHKVFKTNLATYSGRRNYKKMDNDYFTDVFHKGEDSQMLIFTQLRQPLNYQD